MDELTYQSQWLESPFNDAKISHLNMGVKDFLDRLFTDPLKHEWTPVSYSKEIIYHTLMAMGERVRQSDQVVNPYAGLNQDAIRTATVSKCMVPKEVLHYDPTIDPDLRDKLMKKQEKYPGLTSMRQNEALLLESELMKRLAEPIGPVRSMINPGGLKLTKIDMPLTCLELYAAESLVYKQSVILCMVLKDQKGAGKRTFFVQVVWSITGFRIYEAGASLFLQMCPEDILKFAGLMKYVYIQTQSKEFPPGMTVITMDMTKFGDTFPIKPFLILPKAMADMGLITVEHSELMIGIAFSLYNRIELMPWQVAKQFNKLSKLDASTFTDRERKHFYKYQPFLDFFKDPRIAQILQKLECCTSLAEWNALIKQLGFILGVFNDGGSDLNAAAAFLKQKVLERFAIEALVRCFRHSDDGMDTTGLPLPPIIVWKSHCCTDFIKAWKDCGKPKPIVNRVNQTISIRGGKFPSGRSFPLFIMSKLNTILGLFCPRFFGMRPSLAKWGTGLLAEILQCTFDSHGNASPPLIRWAAAIGSDLEGASYSSDLIQAISRVYDMSCNRGSETLIGSMLVAANEMIANRFGVPRTGRRTYFPPQAFGIWWALPFHIIVAGFQSNEARLHWLSDDCMQLKRFLALSINNDIIWKSSIDSSVLFPIVHDTEFIDNEFATTVQRKEFRIHYNRHKKTSLALQRMESALANTLPKLRSAFGLSRYTDEQIKEKLIRYSVARVPSDGIYSLGLLKRYTSTSYMDHYIRASPDVKVVPQLGYYKRRIGSPFSKVFPELGKYTKLTIAEIWDLLWYTAGTDAPIPISVQQTFSLVETLLAPSKLLVSSFHPEGEPMLIPYTLNPKLIPYSKLSETRSVSQYGFNAPILLTFALDLMEDRVLDHSLLLKMRPDLVFNQHFLSAGKELKEMIMSCGFSLEFVTLNFRALMRCLVPFERSAVAAMSTEFEDLKSRMYYLWTFGQALQLDYRQVELAVKREITQISTYTRAIALYYLDCVFHERPTTTTGLRLYLSGDEQLIPTEDQVFELIINTFDQKAISLWLFLNMCDDCQYTFFRYKKHFRDRNRSDRRLLHVYGLSTDDWTIQTERTTTDTDESRSAKWSIRFCYHTPNGQAFSPMQLFNIGRLITYLNVSRELRLKSPDDLADSVISNIAVYGSDLVYQVRRSGTTNYVSIIEEGLPGPEGTIAEQFVYGWVFTHEQPAFNWVITPWQCPGDYSFVRITQHPNIMINDEPNRELLLNEPVLNKTYYYTLGDQIECTEPQSLHHLYKLTPIEWDFAINICEATNFVLGSPVPSAITQMKWGKLYFVAAVERYCLVSLDILHRYIATHCDARHRKNVKKMTSLAIITTLGKLVTHEVNNNARLISWFHNLRKLYSGLDGLALPRIENKFGFDMATRMFTFSDPDELIPYLDDYVIKREPQVKISVTFILLYLKRYVNIEPLLSIYQDKTSSSNWSHLLISKYSINRVFLMNLCLDNDKIISFLARTTQMV